LTRGVAEHGTRRRTATIRRLGLEAGSCRRRAMAISLGRRQPPQSLFQSLQYRIECNLSTLHVALNLRSGGSRRLVISRRLEKSPSSTRGRDELTRLRTMRRQEEIRHDRWLKQRVEPFE
jgi:hypothetical protein